MQEIIILAVLWFVYRGIMANVRKKRREAQDESQAATQPSRTPAAPVQARPSSVWDQINEMFAESESTYNPNSYSDEQGCIGGSIEHVEHEGSFTPGSLDYTPPDYTHGSLNYAPTTDYSPVAFGETEQKPRAAHARLTGKDMRSAVIMAEVLGKPVVLRGN